MPARIVATRPKAATASANHCAPAGSHLRREIEQGQPEHQMRGHRAGDAAGDLRDDVERGFADRQARACRRRRA